MNFLSIRPMIRLFEKFFRRASRWSRYTESISWSTPLIEIPAPQDRRNALVANALSIVDVEAGDPERRPVFEELLGPVQGRWDLGRPYKYVNLGDGKFRTEGISTCGLVGEGLQRRVGLDLASLYAPFVPGQAVSRMVGFATVCKAWRAPGPDRRPRPGDYLVVGSGLATHVRTVIGWEGDTCISVDGGQVDPQHGFLQCIRKARNEWAKIGGVWRERNKPVVGWADVDALKYRDGSILVPEGWPE